MGKSKHPGLLEKALKDIADMNRDLKKEADALKAVSRACDEAKKMCDGSVRDFDSKYKFLQGVMEDYAKTCVEIEDLEGKLAKAKNDKKASAELEKKLDALEKAGDKWRTEYNKGCKAISAQTIAISQMVEAVTTAGNDLLELGYNP